MIDERMAAKRRKEAQKKFEVAAPLTVRTAGQGARLRR
jgi:hypothetical protein